MNNFKIVIPARYGSSRFPGKPLATICGKPMIWHTYQRALETGIPSADIIIATDDIRISDSANSFGAKVVMTSLDHESGTSRLAEVAQILRWDAEDIVVNLQGDEPLLAPELITLTAQSLLASNAGISTLASPITSREVINNLNIVKIVTSSTGNALYFSRAAIPFARDGITDDILTDDSPWLRHIGIYAYRVKTLIEYQSWAPCQLEDIEKLEQLRALFHGETIQVAVTKKAPEHGVDTPEDLQKIVEKLSCNYL